MLNYVIMMPQRKKRLLARSEKISRFDLWYDDVRYEGGATETAFCRCFILRKQKALSIRIKDHIIATVYVLNQTLKITLYSYTLQTLIIVSTLHLKQ